MRALFEYDKLKGLHNILLHCSMIHMVLTLPLQKNYTCTLSVKCISKWWLQKIYIHTRVHIIKWLFCGRQLAIDWIIIITNKRRNDINTIGKDKCNDFI